MKKYIYSVLFVLASIVALLVSCTIPNEPEKEIGVFTIENKCSYYATANVFLIEGNTETELMEFDIPAKGSMSHVLEIGTYRVFARCRTSLYFIDEQFTITKGGSVSFSITK